MVEMHIIVAILFALFALIIGYVLGRGVTAASYRRPFLVLNAEVAVNEFPAVIEFDDDAKGWTATSMDFKDCAAFGKTITEALDDLAGEIKRQIVGRT